MRPTPQQRQRSNQLARERKVKRNLAYMAGVDERRISNRGSLKRYGRDNQGAAHTRGGLQRFRHLPPQMRPIAELELARLMDKAKREGKAITQQKYGSLCANAAFITLYVRCSNKQHIWKKRYWNRRAAIEKWRSHLPATDDKSKHSSGRRTNDPSTCLQGI